MIGNGMCPVNVVFLGPGVYEIVLEKSPTESVLSGVPSFYRTCL